MILLCDGNNLAYRNYATHADLRTSKGEGTGAIYGTLKSLYLLKKTHKPDRMFVFWDAGGSTWRSKLYPAYKAHRRLELDQEKAIYLEEYRRQLNETRKALDMLGVSQVQVYGVEADDLIGIAMSRLDVLTDRAVSVVSSDHDFYQLLRPGRNILRPATKAEYEIMTLDSFTFKYGIDSSYWPDVRALMGDPSDNIPGVRGIGEKRAVRLVKTFGGIMQIFRAPDTGTSIDKYLVDVRLHQDEVRLYRMLSVIPRAPTSTYYDKDMVKAISQEMKKLTGPELKLCKAEFAGYCADKEMYSISKVADEWLYVFGGTRILAE